MAQTLVMDLFTIRDQEIFRALKMFKIMQVTSCKFLGLIPGMPILVKLGPI